MARDGSYESPVRYAVTAGSKLGGRSRIPRLTAASVGRLLLFDQSGSETRTSWAAVFQIDGGDASHGMPITPDASHFIRMRSMVAAGGGSGILSTSQASAAPSRGWASGRDLIGHPGVCLDRAGLNPSPPGRTAQAGRVVSAFGGRRVPLSLHAGGVRAIGGPGSPAVVVRGVVGVTHHAGRELAAAQSEGEGSGDGQHPDQRDVGRCHDG
jgi:hypothetical protein